VAVLAAATGLAAIGLNAVATAPAANAAVGPEQVVNGTFDTDISAPWFSSPNVTTAVVDGRLCAEIPGGTTNPWDAIVGQNGINLVQGETYEFSFTASGTPEGHVTRALVGLQVEPYTTYTDQRPVLTPAGDAFTYIFTATETTPQGQVAFQAGGSATPWRLCVDNVSLRGGAERPVYRPDTGPRVRVNQVAYLPDGPKNATLVTEATTALRWELRNAQGATVKRGRTTPRGVDASSGQNVHSIDFGQFHGRGTGFTLVADGETSRPFDIDSAIYEQLRTDSLKFYYTQRSGIEILDSLRPGYGRPAGHVNVAPNTGDNNVPCQPGVCDYTLDVRGGWYDAGDHGKYVVNGGISTWQLLSEYERSTIARRADRDRLGDGTLAIPESGNNVPDILDEARWNLEFMLSMQVPAGQRLAGMVHHKIHDANWTGLPLMPHLDAQLRELHPPSTAATLNLAAVAAQAARLFKTYDPAFAAESLAAARTAYAAALANPAIYALDSDSTGGGAYGDSNVTDEFYWAAAELFITTGEQAFADAVTASPLHTEDIFRPGGAFDWGWTAVPGRLDLAMVPNNLPDRERVRHSVVMAGDKYNAIIKAHPYGLPYAPTNNNFDWGSNNLILNNMVVLASAYDISGKTKYRNAVLEGINYIFGRNALNISYVTGYGEVSSQNQHSRWYARQIDPNSPNPPRGTLAGGPNSSIQDPKAQELLTGCVGQFCYVDHIDSWSTNELTINWNSALAWVAAFVADQ